MSTVKCSQSEVRNILKCLHFACAVYIENESQKRINLFEQSKYFIIKLNQLCRPLLENISFDFLWILMAQ